MAQIQKTHAKRRFISAVDSQETGSFVKLSELHPSTYDRFSGPLHPSH